MSVRTIELTMVSYIASWPSLWKQGCKHQSWSNAVKFSHEYTDRMTM